MDRSEQHAEKPRIRQTARKSAPTTGNTFPFWDYFGRRKPYDGMREEGPRPAKRARTSSSWASSTSAGANSEAVEELEAHIKELHLFIGEQGLSSKAPLSARERIEKQTEKQKKNLDVGAAALGKSIRESLGETRPSGSPDGVKSSDISKHPLGVRPRHGACGDMEARGSDYRRVSCPLDEPADQLLASLFQARREGDRDWDWTDDLDKTTALRKRLEGSGIYNFLGRTMGSHEDVRSERPTTLRTRLARRG